MKGVEEHNDMASFLSLWLPRGRSEARENRSRRTQEDSLATAGGGKYSVLNTDNNSEDGDEIRL